MSTPIYTARELHARMQARIAAQAEIACDRCGGPAPGDAQHGVVRYVDESGDGMIHDGGCDRCCACMMRERAAI